MSLIGSREIASIPALLLARAGETPDREAFRSPTGDTWTPVSWARVRDVVVRAAAGLRALGLTDEDRVALMSATRTEWILADLAILSAGGATTTVYPSSTPDECAFVITDSGSRVVIVEDRAGLEKIEAVRASLPHVETVVVIDDPGDGGSVLSWDDLLRRGDGWLAQHPTGIDEVIAAITPDRLATLIYTSGTTGRPKGVELLHDSWLYAAGAAATTDILTHDDVHFLWLPLSHAFGKVLEILMIDTGVVTAIDGRVDRIVANLATVRPTVVAAAPRIFEKAHNTIVSTIRQEGGVKLKLFEWARGVALEVARARREGRSPSPLLAVQHRLADTLVLSKIRGRFGGRIRYFVSGSAPLSLEMGEFFDAAGMPILEGYGLTESSAASFVNPPSRPRLGTVGPPLPGTEVRIADDGEILLKSRGIMRGYHGLPDETTATVRDGWLHTGDIGAIDDDGYLRITDRKKELIKTSGGKYVAPALVEGHIKAACPYISQVVVHGDRRNYITALVTLDPDAIGRWAAANDRASDPATLARDPDVEHLIQEAIDTVNADLARHETIKRFAILASEFSIEAGELTPSLKLKRRVVEQRQADVLDSLYDAAVDRV
ncbi:MAG TPA: long-chain fatty acid--CoA ligase [Euzebyales bacterium]|nr:long-chain fatty acid--CoA ligase [Euzebyales bacterium]